MDGRASLAPEGGEASAPTAFERAGETLLASYDWKVDAFGPAPYRPQPAAAEFLMALGLRTGKPLALRAALRSLAVLPKSALADPIEGGFFDRCEGPRWTNPYTRKSLRANAALMQAFALAASWTGDEAMENAALSTVEFIELHLMADEGDLWASAQGPDDEYFDLMGHQRAKRGAPPTTGPASKADAALAISAFVRAGLCLDEPRLIGRARLAMRELWDKGATNQPEEEPAALIAALDLALATSDSSWKDGAIKRVKRVNAMGGFPDENPDEAVRAAALSLVGRLGAQAPQGQDVWRETFGKWKPDPADLLTVAAWGAAHLAAETLPVTVTWAGPRITEPEAKTVRAALGLAWALGPPGFEVTGQGRSLKEAPELRFRCGQNVSAKCASSQDLKSALRSVVDLREAMS